MLTASPPAIQTGALDFESIFSQNFDRVLAVAYSRTSRYADAEDIANEVFEAFYKTYILNGVTISATPQQALMGILKNQLASYYKERNGHSSVNIEGMSLGVDDQLEEKLAWKLFREDIEKCIASFDVELQLVWQLTHLPNDFALIASLSGRTEEFFRARIRTTAGKGFHYPQKLVSEVLNRSARSCRRLLRKADKKLTVRMLTLTWRRFIDAAS